ncbi:hypothetical protein SAMN03080594_101685 [Arenibacter palladensis]|uniref:Uncharacterized protein n=1 Tax=Arenibacter palladensis TaxID=237373 RepID=A0A1M4UML4_9FLAO|nr:hypothetical protein SAMN03080594_101685 [Arenibacter palladensis]
MEEVKSEFLFTKYCKTTTYVKKMQIEPNNIWIVSLGFKTIQMILFDFCKNRRILSYKRLKI